VLRNLASFYNFRGEFDNGRRMAEAILRLADQQQDASMLVDAHLLVGVNLGFVDDLRAGLAHLDKAIAYFRSEPYPAGRYRLGHNPGVACLTTSAFILWILGHPDRALQRANEAIAVATELEHPPSLAYGLYHAGHLHLWRRRPSSSATGPTGCCDLSTTMTIPSGGRSGRACAAPPRRRWDRSRRAWPRFAKGSTATRGSRPPRVF
jgi:hypothetical protein